MSGQITKIINFHLICVLCHIPYYWLLNLHSTFNTCNSSLSEVSNFVWPLLGTVACSKAFRHYINTSPTMIWVIVFHSIAMQGNVATDCLNLWTLSVYCLWRHIFRVTAEYVFSRTSLQSMFWTTTVCCCIMGILQLVGRLSQEELVTQLPSFLPALFDAFSNQSPDVRKVCTILLRGIC